MSTSSAAVLAGGLSSRMGTSKAWLSFGGGTLLERAVTRLQSVFDEVIVVGAPEQELPAVEVPVLRDRVPARGPLGGLEVALGSVSAPALVLLSCDTPFIQTPLLRRLAELAGEFEVVVPRWEDRLHPLAAAYRCEVRPLVSRLLAAGRLRPAFLFEEARTRVLEEEEVRALDPAGLSFINMNTPEEYAQALAQAPACVAFELFGQPCAVAGRRELAVDVPPPATIGSALAALARHVPSLVGVVLDVRRDNGHRRPVAGLAPGFLLSLDGREFTDELDRPIADGDRLLLLAASAGG